MRIFRERAYTHDSSFWLDIPTSACEEYVARFAAVYPWYNKEWVKLGFLKDQNVGPHTSVPQDLSPAITATSITHVTAPAAATGSPIPQQLPNRNTSTAHQPETVSQAAAATTSVRKPKPRKKKLDHTERDPDVRASILMIAAHTAVEILRGQGFSCAIFGSMACKLYGSKREPNVSLHFSSFLLVGSQPISAP